MVAGLPKMFENVEGAFRKISGRPFLLPSVLLWKN